MKANIWTLIVLVVLLALSAAARHAFLRSATRDLEHQVLRDTGLIHR